MNPKRFQGPVLAVHPTWRGFGWVVFEGMLAPVDWGNASAKNAKRQGHLMGRFERLLDRYEPSVFVIETFEKLPPATNKQKLCRGMTHLAASRGMDVQIYSRETVRIIFASVGSKTRHEIAQTIAQHIAAFRNRLPAERKPWMNERWNQSLFDAAALAVAYFAIAGEKPPWG